MTWVDNLSRAKPTDSTDDEYILGYGHGVDGAVSEIKKQHSELAISLLDNKTKLSIAMHLAGLCPGDMLEGSNVLFDEECNNKLLNSDKCVECWLKQLCVE